MSEAPCERCWRTEIGTELLRNGRRGVTRGRDAGPMAQHRHDDDGVAFGLHVERTGSHTSITLFGELDYFTVPLLQQFVTDDRGPNEDIVFDMAGLGFVDVAGISCLASAVARARASGARARVVSPSPIAARVIRLFGLAELMGLREDPDPSGRGGVTRPAAHRRRPHGRRRSGSGQEVGGLPLEIHNARST